MRRLAGFLILILAVSYTLFAISINDVSPSSDLYPYVLEMVQNNIMSLDSNGDFNGTLVVTRADLARILSRLLNYVQGRVQPLTQVSQKQTTTSATNIAISNELSMKIQKLEDAMKKYYNFEAYVTNTSSTLSGIITEIDQIKSQLDATQKMVASLKNVKSLPPASLLEQAINGENELKEKVSSLSAEVENIKQNNLEYKASWKSFSQSIDATLTRMRMNFSDMQIMLNSVKQQKEKESQKLSQAMSEMSSATAKMEKLSKENVALKQKVASLNSTLGSIYFFQLLEAIVSIGAVVAVFVLK